MAAAAFSYTLTQLPEGLEGFYSPAVRAGGGKGIGVTSLYDSKVLEGMGPQDWLSGDAAFWTTPSRLAKELGARTGSEYIHFGVPGIRERHIRHNQDNRTMESGTNIEQVKMMGA